MSKNWFRGWPPGPYRDALATLIERIPGATMREHDGIPVALAEVPCEGHGHDVSLCTGEEDAFVEVTMRLPAALVVPVLRAAGVEVKP